MTKRILLLSALAALTIVLPAITNPPPQNVGRGTSATVTWHGMHVENRKITFGPDAYVEASVSAGERPSAEAIPKHDDIDDVRLGAVGNHARWHGWAKATLTRKTRHPSSGVVTDDPPKTDHRDILVEIELINESHSKKLLQNIAPPFLGNNFGQFWRDDIGGLADGGFWEGVLVGLAAAIAADIIIGDTTDTHVVAYEKLKLRCDPVPFYIAGFEIVETEEGDFQKPVVLHHKVLLSSAELSGEWGCELFHDEMPGGKDPKIPIESNGKPLFQLSHSHVPPASFGPLHSD